MIVILASGSPQVGERDVRNWNIYCKDQLSSIELATARAQAQALFPRIYNRELPPGF
jgi:hypothetical protein